MLQCAIYCTGTDTAAVRSSTNATCAGAHANCLPLAGATGWMSSNFTEAFSSRTMPLLSSDSFFSAFFSGTGGGAADEESQPAKNAADVVISIASAKVLMPLPIAPRLLRPCSCSCSVTKFLFILTP